MLCIVCILFYDTSYVPGDVFRWKVRIPLISYSGFAVCTIILSSLSSIYVVPWYSLQSCIHVPGMQYYIAYKVPFIAKKCKKHRSKSAAS